MFDFYFHQAHHFLIRESFIHLQDLASLLLLILLVKI